jgi:ABC-type nitrate/sulfonate/bicarbonate transport system substrate-binding protein
MLAALAVTATLAACGSSTSATQATSQGSASQVPAPSTVTVALGGGFLSIHAPFLAAMQSGALRAVEQKYGLTVNVQAFGGGNDAMQAVLGGSADFALVSASLLAGADLKGQDLVAVFDQNHGNSTVVIGAKRDESAKGTSIKNFDGASWGYIKEGAPSQLILQDLATRAGLDWKNQQGVAIGSVDATIPSLQSQRIDIVAIGSTVAGKAIQLGLAYPILNGNDTDAARKVWGVQIAAPLVTTHNFARKYPQVTQAIVEAMLKGLLAIQAKAADAGGTYALMPSQFTQNVTQQDFALSWPLDAPAFKGTDGVFHKDAVDSTIKLLVAQKVLPSTGAVSTDVLFDNTFVQGAYRDIGKTPVAG